MKKSDMDLVVGGSILVAIAILIAGVLWLKDFRVSNRQVEYTLLFPQVGMLQTGDPVSVNGPVKGKVGAMKLHGDSVEVVIKLDKDVVLTDSSVISVQNVGLLGERWVGIKLSSRGAVCRPNQKGRPAALIRGRFDAGIGEAMGMVGTVLGEVEVLVQDVAGIVDQTVGDPAFADLFHQMLGRLDKVTRLAQEIVQNNRGNIDVAIKNLRAISVEVHEIVAANRLQIDTIINNGSKLTVEALQITDSVDSIAVSLRSVLATIQRGEGSLGKLVKDETFYHELKRSMAEVDTLVNQINQDGLKLRVKFGFRKPRRAE